MTECNDSYFDRYSIEEKYTSKESIDRQNFILENFAQAFEVDSLIDIGGGYNVLKKVVSENNLSVDVYSLDKYGCPDVKSNLEKYYIPFQKKSFDTVVCVEVLEHLDRVHDIFDQILQISSKYVILSFPNLSHWYFRYKSLRGYQLSDQYGLTPEPTRDRHKWVPYYSEAKQFVRRRISEKNASIVTEKPYRWSFNRNITQLVDILFGMIGSEDLYAWSYYALIEKTS